MIKLNGQWVSKKVTTNHQTVKEHSELKSINKIIYNKIRSKITELKQPIMTDLLNKPSYLAAMKSVDRVNAWYDFMDQNGFQYTVKLKDRKYFYQIFSTFPNLDYFTTQILGYGQHPNDIINDIQIDLYSCLLYTSPSPRD